MSQTSEEKNLPASREKLRKSREKGAVVTARDALASITTVAALIWLFTQRDTLATDLTALFVIDPPEGVSFEAALEAKGQIILRLMVGMIAPLIALVIAMSVLGGMLIAGGPLFSTHPITPDFNRINPVQGAKNLFGRRALMTFLMHVLRTLTLGGVLGTVLWLGITSLIPAPACGLNCSIDVFEAMVIPLLVATAAIMLAFALFDYLVQRAEFLRSQRMTQTESRREHRDQEGDPQLRGQRRRDMRAMVDKPLGVAQATLMVQGGETVVGIRFVEGDTPAPLVVVRSKGVAAARMLRQARAPGVRDEALVALLSEVAVGDYVTSDAQITRLAPHLARTR